MSAGQCTHIISDCRHKVQPCTFERHSNWYCGQSREDHECQRCNGQGQVFTDDLYDCSACSSLDVPSYQLLGHDFQESKP